VKSVILSMAPMRYNWDQFCKVRISVSSKVESRYRDRRRLFMLWLGDISDTLCVLRRLNSTNQSSLGDIRILCRSLNGFDGLVSQLLNLIS